MMSYDEIMNLNKAISRNDKCFCGSGKKFKKCHLEEFEKEYSLRLKQSSWRHKRNRQVKYA